MHNAGYQNCPECNGSRFVEDRSAGDVVCYVRGLFLIGPRPSLCLSWGVYHATYATFLELAAVGQGWSSHGKSKPNPFPFVFVFACPELRPCCGGPHHRWTLWVAHVQWQGLFRGVCLLGEVQQNGRREDLEVRSWMYTGGLHMHMHMSARGLKA